MDIEETRAVERTINLVSIKLRARAKGSLRQSFID
jgi:hypothetical protein